MTRHYFGSDIALFDVLSLTFGCGLIRNGVVVDEGDRTVERLEYLEPMGCALALHAYGGGDPDTSPPLEIVELSYDPSSSDFKATREADVYDRALGSFYVCPSPDMTLQKMIFLPSQLRGVQTLLFDFSPQQRQAGQGEAEVKMMLVLQAMKVRLYRLKGWEFGLGDCRRENAHNF